MRRGKELAPRLVQSNWVNKYLAFRLREIQSKVNCVFTSRPKDFSKIVLLSRASELSRDFNTRKIVYSTEKTELWSTRYEETTIQFVKGTHFFKKPNNFSSYFSFTAIWRLRCLSLIGGFKNSDNSWHLIGHFCKKSTIQNKYPSFLSRPVR